MDQLVNEKEWWTVPVLPCEDIEETLSFWESLGFIRTYCMKSPYQYGVVALGRYALHFVRVKALKPEANFCNCLVMVSDIDGVHRNFMQCFKQHTGKIPHQGRPRISRMKKGQTRFTVTDPGGNPVIFIRFGERDEALHKEAAQEGLSPLQKATALSFTLFHYKEDEPAAAKVLDNGLAKATGETMLTMAHALLARINLALAMGDESKITDCKTWLQSLPLTNEDRLTLAESTGVPDDPAAYI